MARWLDRWFHGRLKPLTRGLFLEIVPFASTAPMGAIALFGLALLVHDGALMIAASATAVGALALLLTVVR